MNNDLTARILHLSTKTDFANEHLVKGSEYLSVVAKDIINDSKLESDKVVYVKADNVYNRNRLEVQGDGTYKINSGGVIKGEDVYFEVTGKVVNGVEEYTQGTYRRADGVFVDNRSVAGENPATISGTNSTTIIAGKLINTGKIGESGVTLIETEDKVENASIGEEIAGIRGTEVLVNGKSGVDNIGGEIHGTERSQVVSEEGKVKNETTITSITTYKNQKGTESPLLRLLQGLPLESESLEEDTVTENIRNIGKIESEKGVAYVEGDKGIENIAGNIRELTILIIVIV